MGVNMKHLYGYEIAQSVIDDLSNEKISDDCKQAIGLLMLYPNLWDRLHDTLLFIPDKRICSFEFSINIEVPTYKVINDIQQHIIDNLTLYMIYLFRKYTNDSIGVKIKDNNCFRNIINNKDSSILYELYFDIEYYKEDREKRRLMFINRLYRYVYNIKYNNEFDFTNEMIDMFSNKVNIQDSNLILRVISDDKLKRYIKELIRLNLISEKLYPYKSWNDIKKELKNIDTYKQCAICGKKFKKLRNDQIVCGKKESREKCRKRFVYLLKQAEKLTFKDKQDLKAQLEHIYKTKVRNHNGVENIYDWDTIVNAIIKKLKQNSKNNAL